jgi:acetyl esterase/lipase
MNVPSIRAAGALPRRACAARHLLAIGAALVGCTGTAPSGTSGTALESVQRTSRCDLAAREATSPIRVQPGLAYAAVDGDTLRMDLALPSGAGPHPLVMLLHGGGWEGGDRSAMTGEMRLLAARGYAAATVSYRLTRGSRDVFPAAVLDVRCAVRWLRTRAPSLPIDGARIGVVGFSAGAHLASMLGVGVGDAVLDPVAARARRGRCLLPEGVPAGDATVQAVVSVAGPQDLRVDGPYTPEQARLVTNFLGVFPGDAPAVAAAASPIAHVRPGAAPFLLVHGTRDELVPIAHARRMRDALHAANVPATLVEVGGMGHAFPALDARDAPVAGCTTAAFLDRWLRAR